MSSLPLPSVVISVGTSPVAVVAPGPCLVVSVQQQQGSAPPAPNFKVLATDGVTVLSVQQGGTNYMFAAPAGTNFRTGQIVGYIKTVSGTVNFSVFADPVVGGQQLPSGAGYVFQTVLTSAQLLALPTPPVQLVPPAPVGFFWAPRRLVLQYRYGSVAYTINNADNDFQLEYSGQSSALISPAATGLVDQTANEVIVQDSADAATVLAQSALAALGLELSLVGTGAALTLGNGTVVATVYCDLVPLQ